MIAVARDDIIIKDNVNENPPYERESVRCLGRYSMWGLCRVRPEYCIDRIGLAESAHTLKADRFSFYGGDYAGIKET